MLTRRTMLASLITVAAGSALSPNLAFAAEQKRRIPWRNWSGSQQCFPTARKAPGSVAELQELIRTAQGVVRPVGAGHSFTALVPTDDTIVSLSRLSGVVSTEPKKLQATLWAGTRLGDIGKPLEQADQALVTMPDIDQQSLAGCLATATHGTGATIGCIPNYVTGLQLVTANGDVIDCDANNNADIFSAAKVSLGALGVITQVKMQNMAPYRLKRETIWREFDQLLSEADSLAANNRNFEFYYIPFTGMGWSDAHNITDEPIGATEKLDTNDGANDLKMARDMLSWSPQLRKLILGTYMKTIDDEITIDSSWKNYTNERNVRFNEMEYHLPKENGIAALKEISSVIEQNFNEVFMPIEVRFVKADDIWMSPFYQRDSCSIAVHRFFKEDYSAYFNTIEVILRKHGGRPHWGKLNSFTREDFANTYPHWKDFVEVRRQLDPNGKFLNKYLKTLFA